MQVELEMLPSRIYDKRQAVTVDELMGRERFTERQARRHEVLIEPGPANRPP